MIDIYSQLKDFKAFEITFLDEFRESKKIYCTVSSLENNTVIVDADNESNKDVFARVGDELKLYIYAENGIYSASSKILSVDKGIAKTQYVIEYPTNGKHSQRREFFRADLQVDFTLTLSTEDDKIYKKIEGKTRDICGKGMSYISAKPFPENYFSSVTFHFNDKEVSTSLKFVYSKHLTTFDGKQKFIHAFAFTDISQRDIDFIVKKCFLYQLELRRKQSLYS